MLPHARAQLVSPGKLSSVHEQLEGINSCTKCHNFGDRTFRNNCLSCHVEIKSRVDNGFGYHAFTKKLECSSCHKEHHGRDFKLIRWDPAKFDHKQTGFELTGKHAGRACKQCHTPANLVQKEILKKADAMKQRTYLGLEPACGNCHEDEHRGQLGKQCDNCHASGEWKATTFSHAKTRFPLVGKHGVVVCEKCHPQQSDERKIAGDMVYLKFKGIAFKSCSECHEDKHHKGSFGNECQNCHNPSDWKAVKIGSRANFDHARTRYPLEGRHREIPCNACHSGGDFNKFKDKDCSSCLVCHTDYHQGQFAAKTDKGDCKRCHTVAGYTPTRFELSSHADARFTLTGAHLATPCDRCHKTVTVNGKTTPQFHWDSFACASCHTDPHAGQFADKIRATGCDACHFTESWHKLQFNHDSTAFPLLGKHSPISCFKCHKTGELGGTQTTVYKIPDRSCAACHSDPHQGQFRDTAGSTSCGRCHTPDEWKKTIFDHATMASFALTGKHAQLACTACHTVEKTLPPLVRYKPIASACSDCHAEIKRK